MDGRERLAEACRGAEANLDELLRVLRAESPDRRGRIRVPKARLIAFVEKEAQLLGAIRESVSE